MGYRGPCSRRGAVLILISLFVGPLSCHRQKQSSKEFATANRLFIRVYADKLEDAYVDPRMSEVEQLLNQVAAESADYAAAQELLARIRTGRQKAQADSDARRAAMAMLNAPVQMAWGSRSPPPPEANAQVVDAGPQEPSSGMTLSDFTRSYSDCFTPYKPVQLTEQGVDKGTVDSWQLKDIANCRDRHPGFEDRVVLTDPKKVLYVVNRTMLETRPANAASATDAGRP